MKMVYILLFISVLLLSAMAMAVVGYGFFGAKGYSAEQRKAFSVVAHRGGLCDSLPENSLASVERAIGLGVKEVEVDVRITKDGELVVFHDADIERLTGREGSLSNLTLEELRCSRLKTNRGCETAEVIPTLGDILWLVQGRCRLLVDAKCASGEDCERFAKALINEVALYQAAEWVAVQSFCDDLLSHIHRLGHPFPLEKLLVFKFPLLPFAYDDGITLFNMSKYSYISSFNFNYRAISPALVEKLHSKGKRVKIWTLGTPDSAPTLPVDGVITDYPELW